MYVHDGCIGWVCNFPLCCCVGSFYAVLKVRDLIDMMADGMEKSVKFVTVCYEGLSKNCVRGFVYFVCN